MKWFDGSIPDAIQRTRTSRSLFVVYIFGEDNDSARLTQSFDDDDVSQSFLTANCVAIKLNIKSEPGTQFCQIYPVVLVPCVFFIGDNGVPLEVTGGYLPPAELKQKLSKALQMHSSTTEPSQLSAVQQPPQTQSSSDHLPKDQGKSSSSPQSSERPCSASSEQQLPTGNAVEVQSSAAGNDAQTSSFATQSISLTDASVCPEETGACARTDDSSQQSAALSLEERKERANQLLAKKREEKAKEEEQKERSQEIERRKLGQEMAKLKQLKADQEKKEFENSYKKQKEEERLAREKVRAEIERDRQERASRYYQEKTEKADALAQQEAKKQAAEAEAEARINATKMESARIQFRLPDGTTVTNVFPSSDVLASLRSYISQRLPNTVEPVTLSTIFPRRTFTEDDMNTSLLQLELAPSAIVVVLLSGKTRALKSHDQTGLLGPLWWLLAQLMALWAFLCTFFSSPKPPTRDAVPQQQQQQQVQQEGSRTGTNVRQRQPGSEGVKRRVDGNIHRLTADDDDDETATWNGNSTQQM